MLDHAEDNLFQIDREMVEERHFASSSRCWPTARSRTGCSR